MSTWAIMPGPRGDGTWFLAEDPEWIHAYAAPGVWLPLAPGFRSSYGPTGAWRRSSWLAQDDSPLETTTPAETVVVATIDVCVGMPAELVDSVKRIMVDQLRTARCVGQAFDGRLVDEDRAHAGASAAAWIIAELRRAFPHDSWEIPESTVIPPAMPGSAEELLHKLPEPTAPISYRRGPEALGMRELLRLLVRAVLRRIFAELGHLSDTDELRRRAFWSSTSFGTWLRASQAGTDASPPCSASASLSLCDATASEQQPVGQH